METFTPLASAVGGLLIGLAAALMLLFGGRIAGISGIAGGMLSPSAGDFGWRTLFVAGLVTGGLMIGVVHPEAFAITTHRSTAALAVAGLLVGFGTRLGNGCTSGHGVCGVSRISPRSLVATMTFMVTGALTVIVVRTVFGGSP